MRSAYRYFKLDAADQLSWHHVVCLLCDQFHVDCSSLFMVSPRIINRILHQGNLESTSVFFPSLNGQKEMEELIKQPTPECWKMHFRGSNSKNFLGGMPLDPPRHSGPLGLLLLGRWPCFRMLQLESFKTVMPASKLMTALHVTTICVRKALSKNNL